ncbi:hypothetical protein LJC45_00905 [Alistipes sp. OttesenSCG-928-B03]|nr:hypothetical protein [Alistipes sp. OttesenSCG-928-B03]
MKTKLLLIFIHTLLLVLGINNQVLAQHPSSTNTAFPSASSMGLVSEVNHTTGTPNIGVPLYNLEYFGIQVQLALSYNTAGIRVEERAAEVGIGWRLTTGGKITRVIRQQPDDLALSEQIWGMPALQVAEACFKTVGNMYKDYNDANSESDLFYYEIPGKSGMFVLDGQGNPHTIPYQSDISIAVVNGAYFTIKDNSGTLYTFGNTSSSRETTTIVRVNGNVNTSAQTQEFIYTSTWHLNSIKNYNGHTVTFEYRSGITETVTSTSYVTTWTTPLIKTDWSSKAKQYPYTTTTGTKVISNITAGSQRITFTTKANMGNSIGEITHTVNNSIVRRYRFKYEIFAWSRIFLTTIEKGSAANEWQELCSFEYNKTHLLPNYGSPNYDSWGYCNGEGNKTHLPKITNAYAPDMANKPLGANKSPVLDYAKACILKTIKYNTGGKVEYIYGLNKHNSEDIGGLRIEKIRYLNENGSEISSTQYEYANSVIGGIGILPRHLYRYNSLQHSCLVVSSTPFYDIYFVSGSPIMYGKITELAADGSKMEYTYSTPNTYPSDIYSNVLPKFWYYFYKKGLQVTFEDAGTETPGMVATPQTSRFWRHGLLLKETKFDSMGANIEETTYNYKHDHSRLVTINGYAPCMVLNASYELKSFLFEYQWESQPVLLENKSTKYFNNPASTTTTTYTYDNDLAIPTSVVQTDSEGNQVKTTYRYAHNLTYSPANVNYPAKNLVSAGILAPIETVTYKNNNVISSELIEYAFVPLQNNSTAVLPKNTYYMPLQAPIANITPANYNGTVNMVYDPRYKVSQTLEYDRQGNVQCTHTPEGNQGCVVYMKNNSRYNTNIKVAEVSNAVRLTGATGRVNQVFYDSFEDAASTTGIITSAKAKTGNKVYVGSSYSASLSDFIPGDYALTYWASPNLGETWNKVTENVTVTTSTSSKIIENNGWVDEVRIIPVDARMKTYTYLPGGEVSSETDHNGITKYMEYDSFGRIVKVLNNDRQILEEYEYNTKK